MTYQVAEMALVWRSPVTGRRFFSRAAAISATTRQIIRKRINDEDSDLPSDLEHEHPEQFEKMFRRLRIKVAKATPTAKKARLAAVEAEKKKPLPHGPRQCKAAQKPLFDVGI